MPRLKSSQMGKGDHSENSASKQIQLPKSVIRSSAELVSRILVSGANPPPVGGERFLVVTCAQIVSVSQEALFFPLKMLVSLEATIQDGHGQHFCSPFF